MMKRILVTAIAAMCLIVAVGEDVTFMSNRRHWEKLSTGTLMKMGNEFMNTKSLPDSAMLCYSLIANRYSDRLPEDELRQCIRATHHVGTIYANCYYNYSEAYKHLLKAQDLAEKHQYHEFEPNILMAIGNLYWTQEGLRHDNQSNREALELQRTAFWKAIDSHSFDILPSIIINLDYIAFSKNLLPQFAKERDTYSHIAIASSNNLREIAKAMNEGVEQISKEEYEQALMTFEAAKSNLHAGIINQTSMLIMLNDYIYITLKKLNRHDEARHVLMQNKDIAQNRKTYIMPSIYGRLAGYYREQHNHALADKYELLWYRTADSIANITQSGNLHVVQFLHEIDKMNEEQKELVVKQQQDRQLLWLVSGSLAMALVLLTLLAVNRNRIKRQNKALYESNCALLDADEQRRQLAEQKERERVDTETSKYGAIKMDENTTEELWQNIIHVMEYAPEIYDESFNVARLSELIGIKPNYVSQAINQQREWTFPTLLAHYRIKEACRRINDTQNYAHYTVEGIGQSVGFKSRSYFIKLFKKQTGLTPSDYIKMAHRNNDNKA